jgi:hypothetical protein
VEGSRVEHQSEAGADPRLPKSRHVGVQDSHVNAGFLNPLAGAVQGLVDDVDARDLPAALCKWDPPDGAAAAEVEHCSIRRLAPALLAPEQLGELLGERGMLREVLPGVEAEAVEELVGNARDGFLEVRSRRLLLRHRPTQYPVKTAAFHAEQLSRDDSRQGAPWRHASARAIFGRERNDDRRPLLDCCPFSTLYRDC